MVGQWQETALVSFAWVVCLRDFVLDWQVPDPHQILNEMSCAVPFFYTRLTPHPFRYRTLPKGGDPAPLCDSTAHQPREPGAWLWDLNKQFGSFNHSGHELG